MNNGWWEEREEEFREGGYQRPDTAQAIVMELDFI